MPFDNNIAAIGVTTPVGHSVFSQYETLEKTVIRLIEHFNQLAVTNGQRLLGSLIVETVSEFDYFAQSAEISMESAQFLALMAAAENDSFDCDILRHIEFKSVLSNDWLIALNQHGSRVRYLYGTGVWSKVQQLTNAFLSDASKVGLLRIAATFAVAGGNSAVSSAEFDKLLKEENGVQPEGIYLRIAQGKWAPDETDRIASILVRSAVEDGDVYRKAFKALTRNKLSVTDIESFAVAVLVAVTQSQRQSLPFLVNPLDSLVGGRRSKLHDPARWQALEFPAPP